MVSPSFRRNFIWNLVGTTSWSFLSLALMIVVTHLNQIDDASLYSFGFSTAAIFLTIGLYSGRTFQVTDKNPKTTDSDYFYLKFLTCGAMLIVAIAFSLLRGYDLPKIIIILTLTFFRILEALCEVINAVLQKHNRLDQVGKSFFFKSLLAFAIFVIVDFVTHDIILSCLMLVLASAIVILCYDLRNLRHINFRLLKPNFRHVLLLLRLGFFIFGVSFLNIYLVNAARYPIDTLADSTAQLVYGIIIMPATLLTLFGLYLIQPFLLRLKNFCFTDFTKFRNLTFKLAMIILGGGLLCLLAAWLAGIPVLEFVYSLELSPYLGALLLVVSGGTLATMATIFSTSLTVMRKTASQFALYLFASLIALCISAPLVATSGVFGACLSYLISMATLCLTYVALFLYQCHKFTKNPIEERRHVESE